jgi:hypothetical protein
MSRLINAKINLDKINDDLIYKGAKGNYLNLSIWIDEEKPDNYGNTVSIQQRTDQGEPRIYLGEGKFFVKKADPIKDKQGTYQKSGKVDTKAMSNINDLPGADDDNSPF